MRPAARKLLLAACAALVPALGRAAEPAPIHTLAEAYARALAASETIGIDDQSIHQAQALYRRALGSSLPGFSYRTLTAWTDGSPHGQYATGAMSQTDAGFRVSQSNLTFYRELAAVKQSKALVGVQEESALRARQLLLESVAEAFFGYLQSKDNVSTAVRLKDFAGQRLVKLRDWVRVGRSREADALAQDSQISTLDSQREESARQVSARADLLAFLTRAAIEPEASDAPFASEPRPLDEYLARLESRPDVKAARWAMESAAAAVRVARGDRFPQIGLLGDSYQSRPSSRNMLRWDAQLTVSVPLFSWGALAAETDFAKAGLTAQELALQATRRSADLEIRNAYRDCVSGRRQLDIERHAVELAERDFDLQQKDESRGLVTAIDVLQSLDRLNTARLALAGALLNARLTTIELEIAAGAKPEEMDLR